jgi:soluble lytic murein transglycosylase-like protein
MIRKLTLTTILVALAATPAFAQKLHPASLDANGNLDALIARHAAANNVPEDLVRRVIKRESGGNPRVISAGNYGLMQIKLPTARSMGYAGTAAGLLDADTNMTYAVKYLAGAYRVANGDANRAVHYYAAGYY